MVWLRFAKLLAAFLFVSGAVGALMPGLSHDLRQRYVYRVAAPGFGLSWILGFLLAGLAGYSLFLPWIWLALLTSLLSLQGLLYLAGREGRGGIVPTMIVLLPLVATIALMVFKPA